MRIAHERPPNFDIIAAAFPLARGIGILFAYGDVIYNPSGGKIPPQLIAHEETHGRRQNLIGVERWWNRYIEDMTFRFTEELIAHQAEYSMLCTLYPTKSGKKQALHAVGKRLCSPLYGKMLDVDRAKWMILHG